MSSETWRVFRSQGITKQDGGRMAAGLKRRSPQVQVKVAVLQINKQAQKCLLALITIQNSVLDRGELFGPVTNR